MPAVRGVQLHATAARQVAARGSETTRQAGARTVVGVQIQLHFVQQQNTKLPKFKNILQRVSYTTTKNEVTSKPLKLYIAAHKNTLKRLSLRKRESV